MNINRWISLILVLGLISCAEEMPSPEQEAIVLLAEARALCEEAVKNFHHAWKEEDSKYFIRTSYSSRERTEQYFELSLEEINGKIKRAQKKARKQLRHDLLQIEEILDLADSRLDESLEPSAASKLIRAMLNKAQEVCLLEVEEYWDSIVYKQTRDKDLRLIKKHLEKTRAALSLDEVRFENIRLELTEELDHIEDLKQKSVAQAEARKAEAEAERHRRYLEEKKAWEKAQKRSQRSKAVREEWWRSNRLERRQALEDQEKDRDQWWDDLHEEVRTEDGKRRAEAWQGDEQRLKQEKRFRSWYGEVAALSQQAYGLIESFRAARLANDREDLLAACEAIQAADRLQTQSEPVQPYALALWENAGEALREAQSGCQKGRFTWVDDQLESLETALQEIEKRDPVPKPRSE